MVNFCPFTPTYPIKISSNVFTNMSLQVHKSFFSDLQIIKTSHLFAIPDWRDLFPFFTGFALSYEKKKRVEFIMCINWEGIAGKREHGGWRREHGSALIISQEHPVTEKAKICLLKR